MFPDILTGLRLIPLKHDIVHMYIVQTTEVSFNPSLVQSLSRAAFSPLRTYSQTFFTRPTLRLLRNRFPEPHE